MSKASRAASAPVMANMDRVYGSDTAGSKWHQRGVASFTGFNRSMFDQASKFQPAEQALLNAGSERQTSERADEMEGNVRTGFQTATGVRDRQLEALGDNSDTAQRGASDRRMALAEAAGAMGARTSARDIGTEQRRMGGQYAMQAGLATDQMVGEASAHADAGDQRREGEYQKAKAGFKGGLMKLAGTAIGVGMNMWLPGSGALVGAAMGAGSK